MVSDLVACDRPGSATAFGGSCQRNPICITDTFDQSQPSMWGCASWLLPDHSKSVMSAQVAVPRVRATKRIKNEPIDLQTTSHSPTVDERGNERMGFVFAQS